MVIIELFVYVSIISMMVVCGNVMRKRGLFKKLDFLYFSVLLTLIISQIIITSLIFSPILPQIRDSNPPIILVCIGTIVTLVLIYIITRITVPSIDTQRRVRAWTGWAMFFMTEFCVCALFVGLPETQTDIYRMPLPLALCIGIKYYPTTLDRITRVKDAAEKRTTERNVERHKDAIINLAIESWHFAKNYERAITRLNTNRTQRYTSVN